jgi:hypothetical protein
LFLRRLITRNTPKTLVKTTSATAPIAIQALVLVGGALELLCWESKVGGAGVASEGELVVGARKVVVVAFDGDVLRVDA